MIVRIVAKPHVRVLEAVNCDSVNVMSNIVGCVIGGSMLILKSGALLLVARLTRINMVVQSQCLLKAIHTQASCLTNTRALAPTCSFSV